MKGSAPGTSSLVKLGSIKAISTWHLRGFERSRRGADFASPTKSILLFLLLTPSAPSFGTKGAFFNSRLSAPQAFERHHRGLVTD